MQQSLLTFERTVLTASLEVSDVMKNFDSQSKILIALNEQEELLNNSFENSKELLVAGLANYLDVLIAQENLLNTQLERVQVNSQKLQSSTIIFRALGGGVK